MGILDDRYYYFKLRNGVEYGIKVTSIRINTEIMHASYRELTNEQKEFYLENPTASIQEIIQCHLDPPYVPPTPDLEEYINQKKDELKNTCYGSIQVSTLEFAMAIDKVENITADSYYSITKARQVVSDFRSQSKKAMQVYNTYSAQMDEAQSIESVDSIYQQAIEEL